MSVTLRDCLKLPSLRLGKVIAGHGGLDSIVTTVSVLEFDDPDEVDFMTPNELLITAFACAKDDTEFQCSLLRKCKANGDVGIVLFYSDMFLGQLDSRLIDVANLINLPLILMPEYDMGLKYSDVISDVMEAIFHDKRTNRYFVSSTIERLSQTAESMRTPGMALRLASDYAKAAFFLCDERENVIASSFWPATNYMEFETVKKVYAHKERPDYTVMEKEGIYTFFRTPFQERSGSNLILYGAAQNEILDTSIMGEVVEIIQLFTVLWNYNLNLATKEAVIPALFHGRRDLMDYICQSNHIDQRIYNRAIIVESEPLTEKTAAGDFLKELREFFAAAQVPVIADLIDTHMVMIYHDGAKIKDQLFEEELCQFLDQRIQNGYYVKYSHYQLFEEMHQNFTEFAKSKEAAEKIYPGKRDFTAADIHFASKVLDICNSLGEKKEYYLKLLEPVSPGKETELLQTLAVYLLDAGSDLKQCADLLFVHKNTVLYRLNKIRALLKCDFSKIPETYDIYMALSVYRVIGEI